MGVGRVDHFVLFRGVGLSLLLLQFAIVYAFFMFLWGELGEAGHLFDSAYSVNRSHKKL